MKEVYTGLESSGKSLQLSIRANEILKRNIKWLKITGEPRTMYFNTPMSDSFIQEIESNGIKYKEFKTMFEILNVDNCDIFIDEIIKFFPASGSTALTPEQMDFISQGAKTGVHLICASQDFSQVHKQFRLLVNEVYVVTKIIGSRRPMRTAPPIKFIWGLCLMRAVNPKSFKGDSATMEDISRIPHFFFIQKEDCDRFDTTFKVKRTQLPDKLVRKQREVGYDENGNIEYEKVKWVG